MRCAKLLVVALAFGVAPSLSGCGEPSPSLKKVADKAGETWDAMRTWSVEKKDEFVRAASPKLDELKVKLAEAKASAAKTGSEAGAKLESGWSDVQEKFDAMKTSTGEQWAKHRDAFVAAYDAYKQKLADAAAK